MAPLESRNTPPAVPAGRDAATPAWRRPVTSLRGIGAERATQLARLGILTVEDLLLHRPRRYEDRRHFRALAELTRDEAATAHGTIVAQGLKRFRRGTKSVFEFVLDDGTARLHCRWWNLPFREKYFGVGDEVFVYGKLVETKPRTMDHPETEISEAGGESFIHINRLAPIYPLTEGLPQRWLRGLIWRTLEQFGSQITEPKPAPDLKIFPTRANALRLLHFPEELTDVEMARRRLALDEFIALQREVRLRREKFEAKARGLPCGGDNRLMKPFLDQLAFKLTRAQTNVLREIRADMGGTHPMRRLLQGDVGSGKTLVAACTALMALESGFNVVLMAPTEILAEQHFRNFQKWFEPLGVKVELQTGSRKTVESRELRAESQSRLRSALDSRPATLFVGTHALLTASFVLPKLGLVIIDEQHKFGVAQREQLVRKGNYPHLLVMTATPIPRTLGLTLYGDLDVSEMAELPPGRGRVKTVVRGTDKLPKVWEFVREKLAIGRQVYVVYPRVEEQDTADDIKAVTREFENVERILAPFHVGLLHGRLNSRQKENVMTAFRANRLQALVATALIEVGLDVPNATILLVENAEQFGLAQLHQLRGRIGRGAQASFCILISNAKTQEARARLRVLEESTDGFRLAEMDLKLRGPGELLGQRQSGLPHFRFGNLADDLELIRQARALVAQTPVGVLENI
jgi:ATP-dependent DNA helicase RecG